MLLKYLRTAWRGLLKNPLFSLINIGGLGMALCACMLILLYVLHEHSFDRFEKNGDRIFAVYGKNPKNLATGTMELLSYVTGPFLEQRVPSVESYTRVSYTNMTLNDKAQPGKNFRPKKSIFADANFFSQFNFGLAEGDPATALTKPFSIVLTQTAAATLFGKQDPLGRLLTYNGKYNLEVTGIAKDPPSNAYLDFDAVCSMATYPSMVENEFWISQDINISPGNFKTYVLLRKVEDASRVEAVANQLASEIHPSQLASVLMDTKYEYHLSPLSKEHMMGYMWRSANQQYLKIFTLVAVLILGLALINYMSLATARGGVRAKEVGVRKTLGAGKNSLALQFYTESALCTFFAFLLGLTLFVSLRARFMDLLHVQMDSNFGYTPAVLMAFTTLLACTILIAGSYPAMVLSRFRPIDNLSGRLTAPQGGQIVRKVLTVLQFTIATGLIVVILVMKQQVYFFLHQDTGMSKDHLVMVRVDQQMAPHYAAFKSEISNIPGVNQTATIGYSLFGVQVQDRINGGQYAGRNIAVDMMEADSSIFSILRLHWKFAPIAGYNSSNFLSVVLNETAVRTLELPADPRGLSLSWEGKDPQMTIAGVVADFAYGPLTRKIGPLFIHGHESVLSDWPNGCTLLARVQPGADLPSLLMSMKKIYGSYPSLNSFSYQFADEAFNNLYQAEDRLASLLGMFTLLATIIACMGLFGLATFSTLQRTKEIGIRKVLGAETAALVRLLASDFLRLVVLAVFLASPIAWWIMHGWLQQFAYRISVSPWVVGGAGLGVAALAMLTVGSLAFKAARANPVDSLRTE